MEKTIIAAGILANAIESAGTSAGSQIAGAPRAMARWVGGKENLREYISYRDGIKGNGVAGAMPFLH